MCAAVLERRLEAVYVSFALFGKWDAAKMVVSHDCHGMAYLRFQELCRQAGLLGGPVTTQTLRQLFDSCVDRVRSRPTTFPPMHSESCRDKACSKDTMVSHTVLRRSPTVDRLLACIVDNMLSDLCGHLAAPLPHTALGAAGDMWYCSDDLPAVSLCDQ